jgi:hypothetical protein
MVRLALFNELKKIYRGKHVLSKVKGTPTNKIRNPNIESETNSKSNERKTRENPKH